MILTSDANWDQIFAQNRTAAETLALRTPFACHTGCTPDIIMITRFELLECSWTMVKRGDLI